jgi:predicted RNA-binding protein YlxR (DUF448 family)
VRTCVGCRARAAKSDLLRVVMVKGAAEASPEASAVPDPRGRMPGRGAHLHPDQACLDLATQRRAFGRAFRYDGPLDLTAVRMWVTANANPERAEPDDERSMSQHR